MQETQHRFDEVLYMLEQERKRCDEDLRRLTIAAAYLRSLLPPSAAWEEGSVVLLLLLGTCNMSTSTYAMQKPNKVIISF